MAATEAQLRVMLDDPAGASELLSTAEYTVLLAIETTVYRAAALAARSIAAQFAEKVELAAGSVRIALQQKYNHYMTLADRYDFRGREGGGGDGAASGGGPKLTGISQDEMETERDDTDRVQPAFQMGQMDNPARLNQNREVNSTS